MCYVKDGVQLLESTKFSTTWFEALVVTVVKPGCVPVQVIGVYVSPQVIWQEVVQGLGRVMSQVDFCLTETVMLGDFNMKSVTKKQDGYNHRLEKFVQESWNLRQHVREVITTEKSMLDLCFAKQVAAVTTVWNHWSDHRIVAVGWNLL